MITIYNSNVYYLEGGIGFGTIAPIYCRIKEELNGMYELEIEHPYDDLKKFKKIQNDRIIKAPTPRGYQFFRIYRVVSNLKSIKVYAKHISYDLYDIPIRSRGINLQNATPQMIAQELNDLRGLSGATIQTDLEGEASNFTTNQTSIFKVILNQENQNSIIQNFGGELLRDNLNISILKNIGKDRGFTVRYGKNLVGLEIDEDFSNYFDGVFPIGKNNLNLPEKYIMSTEEVYNEREEPKLKILELYDVSTVEELRFKAWNFLKEAKTPKINIKVNFELLSKTAEYEKFQMLEEVYLGDVVKIHNEKMNFTKKATVISYEYDSLKQKYIKIELGDFVKDITSNLNGVENAIQTSHNADTTSKQVLNMLNGTITIKNDNLYILIDSQNINEARKIFRFGANGIQYTQNGINGTYRTLIDTNGNISR